jgi:hypothetical protein
VEKTALYRDNFFIVCGLWEGYITQFLSAIPMGGGGFVLCNCTMPTTKLLKVIDNEKEGGLGRWQTFPRCLGPWWVEVYLKFEPHSF